MADAFRELRSAFGAPIKFGAETITALINEAPLSRELIEGGFSEAGDVEVKILLSDLTFIPALGGAAEYLGKQFRVSRVAIPPGGLIGEYMLRPAKR